MTLLSIIYILLAYCIGSIPTGVWYSKLIHQTDVRTLGSGNSGGTNIGRNFGRTGAIIVIAIDVLKGWIPLLLAKFLFPGMDGVIMLTGIACVLGHAYTLWAGFRGGKVVATSIGVLLGFNFFLALAMVLALVILLIITKMVSLSAMVSYGLAAIYIALTYPSLSYKLGFLAIWLFMIYRHRDNVKRILSGTERQVNLEAIFSLRKK
ncbi:glycerol-3-phosphate 1-O-acyltransferase PlsY [Hutsoniella sourekii]|uniref:glycerol-3-phosphate 1-O-acyltransferase PlsY n=1 Tax=Hutsoniella sourekii TaxID=87650 RepID=UPI000489F609|nr:glycerol-3-phosphate 1-O-acyltransferase PlsY [Hutsoniella sourekii]